MFDKKKPKKFKSPAPAKVIPPKAGQPQAASAPLSAKDAAAGVKPNRIPNHVFKPRAKDQGQHHDNSNVIARANAVKAAQEAKAAAKAGDAALGDGPEPVEPEAEKPPVDQDEEQHADE